MDSGNSANVISISQSVGTINILLGNLDRRGFICCNDSTASLYLKYGSSASLTDYSIFIPAHSMYESIMNYTGLITGIWASAGAGFARITQVTP